MEKKLKGKVALITGGARHLGLDAAEILAEAGCDLVITSRNLEAARKTAAALADRHGCEVMPLALDVCAYEQVADTIQQAVQWKGHLDILVNNAGGAVGAGPAHLFDRDPGDMLNNRVDHILERYNQCKSHLERLWNHPVIGRVWRFWRHKINPNI